MCCLVSGYIKGKVDAVRLLRIEIGNKSDGFGEGYCVGESGGKRRIAWEF